jgi:hypothetical protein
MKFNFFPVRPGRPHPPGPVDGLVGGGGEHQELVPLVRQQPGGQVNGQLAEEGQPPGPLDQLVDDGVSDLAELLFQVRLLLVQQLGNVLFEVEKKLKISFRWNFN